MSSRTSYVLSVALLLLAAGLRLWDLPTLPLGFAPHEIDDIRITETVRRGRVEVFYDLGNQGREGLYNTLVAVAKPMTGGGLFGYRIVSVWIGLVALALVYALGKRLFGPPSGVVALALLTVNFWHVLLSRLIAPEGMLVLLVAATLLALSQALSLHYSALRRGEIANTSFTALGALLGLGFYVHPAHFILVLAVMAIILYTVLTRQRLSRRMLGYLGYAIVMMVVLAMPYLISSIRLRELAGAGRVFAGYTTAAKPPPQALADGLSGFMFSGDPNPMHNLPGRPLLDLVSGMLLVIGVLAALRCWRQPRFAIPLIAALALLPLALLRTGSPDFLGFSVILPLVAVLVGLGARTLDASLRGGARIAARLGLIGLLVFNLVWMGRDFFARWRMSDDARAAYNLRQGQLARYLDRTAETTPTVICASNLRPENPLAPLTNAQIMTLMMHTRSDNLRYVDCGLGLIFAGGGNFEQVVLPDIDTLNMAHPYIRDWLRLGLALPDPELPMRGVIALDVEKALADTIGRFTTTAPVSFAPEAPGGSESTFPPVRFGENVTFLGYEPRAGETFKPGDIVNVATYWRVDGRIPTDLRFFTHVLFDPETIILQSDPISIIPNQLKPRDIILQISLIPIPFTMPDGTYQLSIGAYRDAPGDQEDIRLDVFDGDVPRGTRLFLDQVIVARGG